MSGGDVTVIGGSLHRDPSARVGGEIHEIRIGRRETVAGLEAIRRAWREQCFLSGRRSASARSSRSSSRCRWLAVLCILASIVLLFGRGYVDRVSLHAPPAEALVKAGAVGIPIQLLFFPVLIAMIVVMVVTIIGIPLLVLVPFALLAFALLFPDRAHGCCARRWTACGFAIGLGRAESVLRGCDGDCRGVVARAAQPAC